jgi:hypothetical protein
MHIGKRWTARLTGAAIKKPKWGNRASKHVDRSFPIQKFEAFEKDRNFLKGWQLPRWLRPLYRYLLSWQRRAPSRPPPRGGNRRRRRKSYAASCSRKRAVNLFGWVFFLDFARSSTRTEGPHGAYVQMSGRNRIVPHWGGVELLAARTCCTRSGQSSTRSRPCNV